MKRLIIFIQLIGGLSVQFYILAKLYDELVNFSESRRYSLLMPCKVATKLVISVGQVFNIRPRSEGFSSFYTILNTFVG